MSIFNAINQFLFITALLYLIYVLGDLIIKTYSRFKLKNETRFFLTQKEKLLLWLCLSIFFNYFF